MILHVIDNLYPEAGGPTTVVVEFVRHQARMGHKVAVLCSNGPRKPEQRAALEERWRGLGIEFLEVGSLPRAQRAGAVREIIDRLKPELIHIHCVWEAIVRHVALYAGKRKIPYVLSTHGMLHPYAITQKRWKKWVYMQVFPSILKSAGELYSLNKEEADYVAQRFRRPSSVLANGIDVADYERPEQGKFRAKHPALAGRDFILFVGRLHPIKGIDLLTRSFAHARKRGMELDLVIVGPDDGARAGVESLARELGISDRVHFTGGLFGEEKRDAFAACTIFAHRPRFEGFGITVVEGLASAKPVVTTKECRLDGAAEAGALRQAADTDDAFGDALYEIATSPERARALGARGRAWVLEMLDWESLVRRVDESYLRVRATAAGK